MRRKINYRHQYDLVLVCAWCEAKNYKPLKKGQVYTHGICLYHKQQILLKISSLGARQ